MTSWSVQPSGVVAVLKDVDTSSTGLGEALNALSPALQAAVTATQSPAISDAVQAYFEQEEAPRIQAMSARIAAAASGVVTATEAYVNGDLQMAANAQSASVAAVYPAELPRGVM
jgi:isopentenyl diphosphate isomerase/L-lactate dehydrogenase-like FMN-dependent dehydrogenase